MIDLTEHEAAKQQISGLRRHSWVDGKTRGVFIDCAFYNSNLEAWLVSRSVYVRSAVRSGSEFYMQDIGRVFAIRGGPMHVYRFPFFIVPYKL